MGVLGARFSAIGLGVAVLLLLGLGVVSHRNGRQQAETANWVAHTHQVIDSIDRVVIGLAVAESGIRGYAITHDERLLQEFEPSVQAIQRAVKETRELTSDNSEQQGRVDVLEPQMARRIAILTEARERLREGKAISVTREAIDLTESIRSIAAEMIHVERLLLERRKVEAELRIQIMVISSWTVLGVAVLLVSGAFYLLSLEMKRRALAEKEVMARNAEQTLLLELDELLQACRTSEESYDVIARFGPMLLEGDSGALYLFRASRDLLEGRATWGEGARNKDPSGCAPDECWALRRGQVYQGNNSNRSVLCKHFVDPAPAFTMCLPLSAHGEMIGVLFLGSPHKFSNEGKRRASVVAEQIGMALANMQLRETLRNQSIRDALTGLFNRRYAEETLQREIYRSAREKTSLGILMIDVDHFKRFNDSFGHDAGDYVLKSIASVLLSSTRGGDVVSRFGGEELLVVLAHSDPESSYRKAEQLRTSVAALDLKYRGHTLGPVTVSIGVAIGPEHGEGAGALVGAADAALYRAKHAGRNKVFMAGASESGHRHAG